MNTRPEDFYEPNAETVAAIDDAKHGRHLVRARDADEFFALLDDADADGEP